MYPTLVGVSNISLGPLEQEVMKQVWLFKSCTTRQVHQRLSLVKAVSYNTVQTIMTRLFAKGLLSRRLEGKTHIYIPLHTQQKTLQSAITGLMSSFLEQFGEEALVAFVDGLGTVSVETKTKLVRKLLEK